MAQRPSTLKDLWSADLAYKTKPPQPSPPKSRPLPSPAEASASGAGGEDDGPASRTEDLEHLFGGSDLSTAVKALYDFDAPHEFFGSLNRFVKKKDSEIEDVCSSYYQEFIRSNQELLGVRVDIRELKGEVTGLNDEIQEAGKVYLQKCEKLIELRQMRHNSRQTKAELERCCKILEMCARATSQMAARQYYPALKTLQQLEQKYLAELSAHAFVSEVADRIPALQREIKQRVLSDFLAWMAAVGEATHDVGEHSLAWMLRQKETAAATAGAKGGATGSPTWQSRERRRSSTASAASGAGGGGARDFVPSRASSGSISGGEQGSEHSPTHTGQSVFDLVHLDFEPLYECVHIFQTLGKLSELRESYAVRRRAELEAAEHDLKSNIKINLDQNGGRGGGESDDEEQLAVFGPQFSEDMDNFLKHLAGFFIIEDTVLHTATGLANGPNAVDPHALWATAMAQ